MHILIVFSAIRSHRMSYTSALHFSKRTTKLHMPAKLTVFREKVQDFSGVSQC